MRQHGDPDGITRPLGEWPELDIAAIKEKAMRNWRIASRMVNLAAAHRGTAVGDEKLLELGKASQQRCATPPLVPRRRPRCPYAGPPNATSGKIAQELARAQHTGSERARAARRW